MDVSNINFFIQSKFSTDEWFLKSLKLEAMIHLSDEKICFV